MSRFAALVLVALAAGTAWSAAASRPVSYPDGYRAWAHVKSMAITDAVHPLFASFGGIHHVYANPAALNALRSGKDYPDGAIFVFDLLEAKSADDAWTEGPRKFIGVMRRDRKAYASTGGWGYEAFAGDSKTERVVKDGGASCFGCHQSQAKTFGVYSAWRP
jgi:hypothetical protein